MPTPKKGSPSKTSQAPTTVKGSSTSNSPQKQANNIKQEPPSKTVSQKAPTSTEKPTTKPVATATPQTDDQSVLKPKKVTNDKPVEKPADPITLSPTKSKDMPATSGQTKGNVPLAKYGENTAPEKKSFIKEFDTEVIGKKELEQLNDLYPSSMTPSLLDKEAKKPEFKLKNIKANDMFPLALCEFLDLLFQKMILDAESIQASENAANKNTLSQDQSIMKKQMMLRRLGFSRVDHPAFWKIIFTNKCELFENILIV